MKYHRLKYHLQGYSRQGPFQQGMTLVELLVVAAIICGLLAITVPMIKPMLESRKTYNAAQVLAGVMSHARLKSIQEQKSYGVRLIPFETAPTVALQLRQYSKGGSVFENPPDIRVKVEAGIIVHYCFHEGTWQRENLPQEKNEKLAAAQSHFSTGSTIQFNHLGKTYQVGKPTDNGFALVSLEDRIDSPSVNFDHLRLPEDAAFNDALEYRISNQSDTALALLPPQVMPRGTVVDLLFSGGETLNFDGEEKTADGDIPLQFSASDEVIVMFSPAGNVDKLHIIRNGEIIEYKVNEMLYFCVGDWDRQIDSATNETWAEDGKSNLQAPATYWVTLHPKTGSVSVTENAPIKKENTLHQNQIHSQLHEARKFAREHFFNVGNW